MHNISAKPLLLLASEKEQNYLKLLADCGFELFVVKNHAQLLEWAALLPCACIIFNRLLIDANEHFLRQLVYLHEQDLLPELPVWGISLQPDYIETARWKHFGIRQWISPPDITSTITHGTEKLMPRSTEFYHVQSNELLQEMPARMKQAMPELKNKLSLQIIHLKQCLSDIEGRNEAQILDDVHGARSASLALGYDYLAALLAQIEYVIRHNLFENYSGNWRILKECLPAKFHG